MEGPGPPLLGPSPRGCCPPALLPPLCPGHTQHSAVMSSCSFLGGLLPASSLCPHLRGSQQALVLMGCSAPSPPPRGSPRPTLQQPPRSQLRALGAPGVSPDLREACSPLGRNQASGTSGRRGVGGRGGGRTECSRVGGHFAQHLPGPQAPSSQLLLRWTNSVPPPRCPPHRGALCGAHRSTTTSFSSASPPPAHQPPRQAGGTTFSPSSAAASAQAWVPAPASGLGGPGSRQARGSDFTRPCPDPPQMCPC